MLTSCFAKQATHGNQKLSFYTIPEYENWKESLGPAAKNWSIKYYKVSRRADIERVFSRSQEQSL